jgi:hypothetical protein
MGNQLLIGVISSIIASVIILLLGLVFRRKILGWIKKMVFLVLTSNRIAGIHPYKVALKRMEKCLTSTRCITELKVMCFSGKDLTRGVEEGGLLEEIKSFLNNGGRARFLILNPRSLYVNLRAEDLNKNVTALRSSINITISNISHEFKRLHPAKIEVRTYSQLPIFRLNFVPKALILGFYSEVRSYENYFYEIPDSSHLYAIFNRLFEEVWSKSKNVEV